MNLLLKRYAIFFFLTLLFIFNAKSQLLLHPWSVIDGGGGTEKGSGFLITASAGQMTLSSGSAGDFNLDGGFIPGESFFSGTTSILSVQANQNWNMVSVPLIVNDFSKLNLFPSASSNAFEYSNGYIQRDTLSNGKGYWLKFPEKTNVEMTGASLTSSSIPVAQGWNMVGAISYPVASTDVVAFPPLEILSSFFGYSGTLGYFEADTLTPGNAYWVKVSEAGELLMQVGNLSFRSSAQKKLNAK
ncbi:MAG: hypothetical protein HY960_16075 [Ignavibacteriae bacterium]|nr:hypothetical protein [Ignavibacteriota bacterium]